MIFHSVWADERSCYLEAIWHVLYVVGWMEKCQMEQRCWITLWFLWGPCRRTTLAFTGVRWQTILDCAVETLEYAFRVSERLETCHTHLINMFPMWSWRNNNKQTTQLNQSNLLKCWLKSPQKFTSRINSFIYLFQARCFLMFSSLEPTYLTSLRVTWILIHFVLGTEAPNHVPLHEAFAWRSLALH